MLTIQTSVVNNPTFIELQYITLKNFVKGDYKFVVYNHAKDYDDCSNYYNVKDNNYKKSIRLLCEKLNIECIDIDDNKYKGNPSMGTATAMNYILNDSHLKNPGKYLVLDSDMFLINEMKTSRYDDYDCAYVPQIRNDFKYMWNGIYYFDTNKMKNANLLNWNMCQYTTDNPQEECSIYTDTGGMTNKWITTQKKNHNVKEIEHLISGRWNEKNANNLHPSIINFCKNDKRNTNGNFFSEMYDDIFLHYRAGGNWQRLNKSVHEETTQNLKVCIYDILF